MINEIIIDNWNDFNDASSIEMFSFYSDDDSYSLIDLW